MNKKAPKHFLCWFYLINSYFAISVVINIDSVPFNIVWNYKPKNKKLKFKKLVGKINKIS